MRWHVSFTSFGDMVSVAVYAPDQKTADRIADLFLEKAGVSVDGWQRRTTEVKSDLDDRCWRAARRRPGHVFDARGL